MDKVRGVAAALLGLVLIVGLPTPAAAQRKLWGVTATFVPVSSTVDFSKYFYDADAVSLDAQGFRIGVSRGAPLLGDWSLLLVRRAFEAGGTVERDGIVYTMGDDVKITGFEAEKFAVKGAFKDRVVLGVIIAAGVGVVQGTMTSINGPTDAENVLTTFGADIKVQPMFRLEFGVGVVVARGFRIRASGGFDWPGFSGAITASYFFGDR